jgi:hypothetical protein
MPPELLAQGRLTTAADVYSFGIISEWQQHSSTAMQQYRRERDA